MYLYTIQVLVMVLFMVLQGRRVRVRGGGGRKIVLKVMVHGLYNFDRKIKYAPGR